MATTTSAFTSSDPTGTKQITAKNPLGTTKPIIGRPKFTPEHNDNKMLGFIHSDPEVVFNKAKTLGTIRKEGLEVETEDLNKVLDMSVNGSTVKEWIDSLPKEERLHYYRHLGKEYVKAKREKRGGKKLQYIANALIGAGIGDFAAGVGTPLTAMLMKSMKMTPKFMSSKPLTAIHLGAALGGAAIGAAMTPGLLKRRNEERKGAIDFNEKIAASKDEVDKIKELYSRTADPEVDDVEKEMLARQVAEEVLDAYIQETSKVESLAAPAAGVSVLADSISRYMASRSKEDKASVLKAMGKAIKGSGMGNIPVDVVPGLSDPAFGKSKHFNSYRIKTPPDTAMALHEVGHGMYRKEHPVSQRVLKTIGASPYSLIKKTPFGAARENAYFLAAANKALVPRAVRPMMSIPFSAMAGMTLMSEDVRKSIGGDNNKVIEYLGRHPELFAAAGTVPLLTEEAKASSFAVKQLAKQKGIASAIKGSGKLAIPFLSYLAGAAATVLGAKSLGDYFEKKNKIKKEKAK